MEFLKLEVKIKLKSNQIESPDFGPAAAVCYSILIMALYIRNTYIPVQIPFQAKLVFCWDGIPFRAPICIFYWNGIPFWTKQINYTTMEFHFKPLEIWKPKIKNKWSIKIIPVTNLFV